MCPVGLQGSAEPRTAKSETSVFAGLLFQLLPIWNFCLLDSLEILLDASYPSVSWFLTSLPASYDVVLQSTLVGILPPVEPMRLMLMTMMASFRVNGLVL